MNTIQLLTKKLVNFRNKRDWKKYHSPLNLAVSLQLEAAEVLELFQWKTNQEFIEWLKKDNHLEMIADELADVFAYLLLLAQSLNINLESALKNKIKKNNQKYPIEKAKGNAKKYTEFA